jgi:hypothetical protein
MGEIVTTFSGPEAVAEADRRLLAGGFRAKEGFLRNPNVFVIVIDSIAEGPRWNASRQAAAERMIKGAGGTVLSTGRIAARVGPDGRTPIVMLPADVPVFPIEARRIGQITFRLTLPNLKAARQAQRYLDGGYKTTVSSVNHRAELTAVCRAETHNAMDVTEDFATLAKRFGGRFDSMDGPG